MGGFIIIGPMLGFLFAMPFINGGLVEFIPKLSDPLSYPEVKTPLFIIQGSATLFGLVLFPALYYWAVEKRNPFKDIKPFPPLAVGLVLIIMIGFIVVDSVIIEWNTSLVFPEFLKNFETWARDYETRAGEITKFLTTFDNFGAFVFGFIVIAILPGIGEELVFRGLLQPILHRATNNIHVAIWFSAILFSAIHMQFFGFVPRMLLGALFGYLYYWSDNLAVPMVAHFLNNGFSVIGLYLYQQGKITTDIEATNAAPWPVILVSAIITALLLVQFKKFFQSSNQLLT
jgi:hypothetical protein